MAKRVTIIVPEWPEDHTPTSLFGCKIEAVEDMPEPAIIQEFQIRIASPGDLGPLPKSSVEVFLRTMARALRVITVTEVTP